MKKIILYQLLLFSFATGCELLDKEPLNMISDAQLWNDPALIDGYLRDCYSDMKFFNDSSYDTEYSGFTNGKTMTETTSFADEAVNLTKQNWNHLGLEVDANDWWGYPVVRKLNLLIEKLQTTSIDESIKRNRLGEARFLRAFAYFNMVKRYGGVPLILRAQQPNDSYEELYPKREKEENIYQFIIDEIDDITEQELLPKSYESKDLGRPSYYAALALKSRAALYAGSIAKFTAEKNLPTLIQPSGVVGIPAEKAEYFFQESYNASNEIILSKQYQLYKKFIDGTREGYIKNYQNIFLDENNIEVIFSERFDGPPGKAHSLDMWECPMGYNGWSKGQFSYVLPAFVDSYENTDNTYTLLTEAADSGQEYTLEELYGKKDPRFAASIYTEGTIFKDEVRPDTLEFWWGLVRPNGSVLQTGAYQGIDAMGYSTRIVASGRRITTPFGVLKYLDVDDPQARSAQLYSKTDWIVFRLAEIYLNRAEAAYELGIEGAEADIQLIRDRAGMPAPLSFDRETIRHERQIELAFEGNRFHDIRRWREGPKYLGLNPFSIRYQLVYASVKNGGPKRYIIKNVGGIYAASKDRTFQPRHYYNPITLSRKAVNKNLEGNPGW